MKTLQEAIKELVDKCETTRQLIDILVALRGPDNGDMCLKEYTTCRIRAIVYDNADVNPFQVVRTRRLSNGEQYKRRLLLLTAPAHFQSHYQSAVRAIQEVFKYDLETETEL